MRLSIGRCLKGCEVVLQERVDEAIATPDALQQNAFVCFLQETDVSPGHSSTSPEEEAEEEELPKPAATKPAKSTQPEVPAAPAVAKVPQERQESLPFEPLNRGRFEKSEPTIVNGQDLDVPTFMRRNIKIK